VPIDSSLYEKDQNSTGFAGHLHKKSTLVIFLFVFLFHFFLTDLRFIAACDPESCKQEMYGTSWG
jgi:hypothetical protein